MSYISRIVCPSIVVGVGSAAAMAGPEWIEGTLGDAGSQPRTAQPTGGAGALARISGDLMNPLGIDVGDLNIEDMYIVRIDSPGTFRATTRSPDGEADFDTQLWLFTLDGMGLLGSRDGIDNPANVRPCKADFQKDGVVGVPELLAIINKWGECACCKEDLNCDSNVGVPDLCEVIANWGPYSGDCFISDATIEPIATDGTGQTIPGPGLYLLAVSSAGTIPVSKNGPIFSFGCDPTELSGPDGPGAGLPIEGWVHVDCGTPALGEYRIAISGVTMSGLFLDIKPGMWPNPHLPNSGTTVPMAMCGTGGFEPTSVDVASLSLRRADGVGSAVPVIVDSVHTADTATPFSGSLCDGHALSGDGVADLNMRFSSCEIRSAFELDDVAPGTSLQFEVNGLFTNGSLLGSRDCMMIVPPMHMLASTGTGLQVVGNDLLRVDGVVQVNSSNLNAIYIEGNGVLEAQSFNVNGGFVVFGTADVIGPIIPSGPIADPHANLPEPSSIGIPIRSSSHLNLGGGTHHLLPGRYIGGISMGSGSYNFAPGMYFIEGGGFVLNGQGTIQMDQAMLYNTNSTSPAIAMGQIKCSGNANVMWTPPEDGLYEGIAIFQDRTLPLAAQPMVVFSGNRTTVMRGLIYAPMAPLSWSGNAHIDIRGGGIVARQVLMSGNTELLIGGCDG